MSDAATWAERNPIRADLYRYRGQIGIEAFVKTWFHNRAFRFLVWHRLTTRFRTVWPLWLPLRLVMERSAVKYGIDISGRARLGPGLHISHFGGIIVGPTSIGQDCNISRGVTIGHIRTGPREGRPVVGSGVWIGVNAIVVGGITIGDGAAIAPGAYVNFDVPPGALVMGNPGAIVGLANPDYVRFRTAHIRLMPPDDARVPYEGFD